VNRDPLEEAGGINLYRFVANDPVNRWDHLGQFGVVGFVVGAVVDVGIQITVNVATGNDWHDISVGSAVVSGAASATGVGSLALAKKATSAYKLAKSAQKAKTLYTSARKGEVALNHVGDVVKQSLKMKAKDEAIQGVGVSVGVQAAKKTVAKIEDEVTTDTAVDEPSGGSLPLFDGRDLDSSSDVPIPESGEEDADSEMSPSEELSEPASEIPEPSTTSSFSSSFRW
jgi:hypothetical protein